MTQNYLVNLIINNEIHIFSDRLGFDNFLNELIHFQFKISTILK